MRDPKSFFLLVGALLLITISFIIVSIWGYHFYVQDQDSKPVARQLEQTFPTGGRNDNRDSLELVLDSVLGNASKGYDSLASSYDNALNQALLSKASEYRDIKRDIIEILNEKAVLKDTSAPDERIRLLQRDVEILRGTNIELKSENDSLRTMLGELTLLKNEDSKTSDNEITQKRQQKSTNSLPLLVSHLNFTAISADGSHKIVTTLASQTNEFSGSFELNIQSTETGSSKIFIVILAPDGRVLPNEVGKLGIFYSPTGNKSYSTALLFDALKDNHRTLQFSIPASSVQKGKYTMQIYHGGLLIGKLNKMLL